MRNEFLKFSNENAKLAKSGLIVWTFSLVSGRTCPGACQCLAWVDPVTRKIKDGKDQVYRCFSATAENAWPTVYAARHHNLQVLLKHGGATADGLHRILTDDFPPHAKYFRIHVGGDFYSQAYFDAWMRLAGERPGIKFYAYTKSLNFWVERLGEVPVNMVLTASRGGKFDELIDKHRLKETVVVSHPEEAAAMSLEIDHDDTMAMTDDVRRSALLIHGTQPAGSEAGVWMKRLRAEKVDFSYRNAKRGPAKPRKKKESLAEWLHGATTEGGAQ